MTLIDWKAAPQPEAFAPMEQEVLEPSKQELLNQEAAFSLNGHELVDPEETRGYVNRIDEIKNPTSMAGNKLPKGVRVFEVGVVDAYVAADPEAYAMVRDHVQGLEAMIRRDGIDPLTERAKEHPYMKEGEVADGSYTNPYTEAWLAGDNVEGLKAWHSNVPTAEALGYLTDPCHDCTIVDNEGNTHLSSPETAAHLRFVDDAVGIRDRAIAMESIAGEVLGRNKKGSNVRWLSLASGTGEPSIIASKNAAEKHNLNVDLVVADLNPKSLKFVKELAKKHGFDSKVTTVIGNIMASDFVDRLVKKTGTTEKFKVVENMGFQEYLPQEGDELGAYKNNELGLPQASEFTKMAYDLVEPGGSLISGNMVLDRPQIDFVFGIVNWPIINARSEESILRVYEQAGIPMKNIKLYRVHDEITNAHVYDIVEVKKPITKLDRARKMAANLIGRFSRQPEEFVTAA